jgi:hypothetical protein
MAHDIAESIVKMAEMRVEEDKAKWKEAFIAKCQANRYIIGLQLRWIRTETTGDGNEMRVACDSERPVIIYNVDGQLFLNMSKHMYCWHCIRQYFRNSKNQFYEPPIKGVVPFQDAKELDTYINEFFVYRRNASDAISELSIRMVLCDGNDESTIKKGDLYMNSLLLMDRDCPNEEQVQEICLDMLDIALGYVKKAVRLE